MRLSMEIYLDEIFPTPLFWLCMPPLTLLGLQSRFGDKPLGI